MTRESDGRVGKGSGLGAGWRLMNFTQRANLVFVGRSYKHLEFKAGKAGRFYNSLRTVHSAAAAAGTERSHTFPISDSGVGGSWI